MMPQVNQRPPSAHKMPQLDSLRAFAVMSVLFVHFVTHPPRWLAVVPWAACGVQLFFVLSGFLITGILLDCRKQVGTGSRLFALRQFYARRFLRIIPLYYAVVIVGWLIRLPDFDKTLGWNLAYSTNFYIVWNGRWIEAASHLWTLSVEEQFYLLWPWIVLFLPDRWLLPTFAGAGIFAIVYRVIFCGWFGEWMGITPFASFDCFAAGALLAIAQRRDEMGNPGMRRVLSIGGLVLGIPLVILAFAWHVPRGSIVDRVGLLNVAMPLLFTPLISRAADGFSGVVGKMLTLRPLMYLGTISYGIYIYHLPVKWVINLHCSSWLRISPNIPQAAVYGLVTIGVAAISWHFFELPINRLKRFFPYHRAPLATPIKVRGSVDETAKEPLPGVPAS